MILKRGVQCFHIEQKFVLQILQYKAALNNYTAEMSVPELVIKGNEIFKSWNFRNFFAKVKILGGVRETMLWPFWCRLSEPKNVNAFLKLDQFSVLFQVF